jgi:predicted membrane protein
MKTNKWFWGIFFMCAAAAVVLNALGYLANVSLWSIIFTVVLIPIFVESMLRRRFAGIFFPLAIIGILFSKPLQIEALSPLPLLAAALFLSIAFYIMFRKKKDIVFLGVNNVFGKKQWDKNTETIEYSDDNEVECSVSFASATKYIHCPAMRKANLATSFGALVVFFDNARLDPDGAEMNVDCSLGSLEIYIPKDWKVENRITSTLGAVEEKNKQYCIGAGPLVVIKGECLLGSVSITYV